MARLLFLVSSPTDENALRLNRELRLVCRAVAPSENVRNIAFQYGHELQPNDADLYLSKFAPHLVHFCGHGTSTTICCQNGSGESVELSQENLVTLFRHLKGQVQCVVLNCCRSESLAQMLSSVVGCAIGMRGMIDDDEAIRFSEAFYASLARDGVIRTAHALGCSVLGIHSEVPRLFTEPPAGNPTIPVKMLGPRIDGRFVLNQNGRPKLWKREQYYIALRTLGLPAGTQKVSYSFTFIPEQNTVEENPADDFSAEIYTYGKINVTARFKTAEGTLTLNSQLIDLLRRAHPWPSTTAVEAAISDIADH